MTIPFIKMHGLGNDYVYIDCFPATPAAIIANTDLSALARAVSDRHFGIGSDGLVLILPCKEAEASMRIFNADGSEAEMCGNAIRCVGKYLYESGLCTQLRRQISVRKRFMYTAKDENQDDCGYPEAMSSRPKRFGTRSDSRYGNPEDGH